MKLVVIRMEVVLPLLQYTKHDIIKKEKRNKRGRYMDTHHQHRLGTVLWRKFHVLLHDNEPNQSHSITRTLLTQKFRFIKSDFCLMVLRVPFYYSTRVIRYVGIPRVFFFSERDGFCFGIGGQYQAELMEWIFSLIVAMQIDFFISHIT